MRRLLILALLTTALLAWVPTIITAQTAPVLFFSDLTSAPKTGWEGSSTKGAAVTIWGEGFGNAGYDGVNNYVTVNGAMITEYAEWGETLGPARDLDRITFWLNSNCQDGLGEITLTVDGIASDALPFTVRDGNIYFISVDGDDSYDGSLSAPWKSPMMAMNTNNAVIQPGDTIYIRSGLYTPETINMDQDGAFMRGRGDNNDGDFGTEAMPVAVVGYPGEMPILDMTGFSETKRGVFSSEQGSYDGSYGPDLGHGADYFTFAKLQCMHMGGVIDVWGVGYRIIGNYFKDNNDDAWTGVIMVDTSIDTKIYGNYFEKNGYDAYKHDIYIKTHNNAEIGTMIEAENTYVGWNEFDSWTADLNPSEHSRGGCIEIQTESTAYNHGKKTHDVYIHDNYFHDGDSHWIYGMGETYGNYVYNNIVQDTTVDSGGGTQIGDFDETYFFNNIFYHVGDASVPIFVLTGNPEFVSKNNIYVPRPGQAVLNREGGTYDSDHDLFQSSPPDGTGITVTNPVLSDPAFVSAEPSSWQDFQLQPDSPAIDAGLDVSPIATTDFLGNPRPMDGDSSGTAEWDIGAYEYTGTYMPPQCHDTDSDGYGSPVSASCTHSQLDCNDNNPNIHPGATEICGDGIDQDCSGSDLACPSCSDGIQNQGETGVDCGGPCPACPAGPVEIIIDNSDPGFTTSGGGGWWSSGYPSPYEADSLGSDINEGSVAIWTPTITQPGSYGVYAWWTSGTGRVNDAKYTINHTGGSDVVVVDQKSNGGQWNLLGTYTFNAGTSGSVSISDTSTDPNYVPGSVSDSVCADAVRFVYSWQTYHPADTDESCSINDEEVAKYIGHWYMDSTTYPMNRVIEVVGYYKSGANSCS